MFRRCTAITTQQLDPSEAADKLLGYVREIKRLGEENITVNRAKATTFKTSEKLRLQHSSD
jgi:hypothetical protein